jgi:hypothetical protein
MKAAIQALLVVATTAMSPIQHPHAVRTAQEAIDVAIQAAPGKTTQKSWAARYDAASRTWSVCLLEPISSPQSGYRIHADASTGRILRQEIIN